MDWYAEVKKIMDIHGVPEPVWVGAATAESGLNPHPPVGDAGTSFGLFQINVPGNQGIPGINKLTREQLENPLFQALIMAPRFASGWREAQNKGLTGAAAYNYAAWVAEKPYGYPYEWGLADYSKRTGITDESLKNWKSPLETGKVSAGTISTSTQPTTPSTLVPEGTATDQKPSWLEEKIGLSANWRTNFAIGVIGVMVIGFGLWGLIKQEVK